MPTICDYSNTLKLEIQKFQKTVSILRLFKMEMRWKDWIVHVSITTVRALVYCAIVVSMQCMNICIWRFNKRNLHFTRATTF